MICKFRMTVNQINESWEISWIVILSTQTMNDPLITIERSLSIHSPLRSIQYRVTRFNCWIQYPSTIHLNHTHEEWFIPLFHFHRIHIQSDSSPCPSSDSRHINTRRKNLMCDGSTLRLWWWLVFRPLTLQRRFSENWLSHSESRWLYSVCIHSWPNYWFSECHKWIVNTLLISSSL